MKTNSKTTQFLAITFTLSYLLAAVYWLSGGDGNNKTGFMILGIAYMFIPSLAVLIVKKWIHKESIKTDLMISFKINKWFFIAWGIMPLITFGAFAISLLFPHVNYSPEMSGMFSRFEANMTAEQIEMMKKSIAELPVDTIWITLLQGMLAGISINAIAGFGEELGWRGLLLNEFRKMSFFKACIYIGLIWGIWHAPLILMGHNYPQHPQIGVIMMSIWCVLLSPLFIYITLKAKSVIAAAILHGTLNATAGLAIMKIDGGNDLTTGLTGLPGFVALLIFIAAFFVYDYFISRDKLMCSKIEKGL